MRLSEFLNRIETLNELSFELDSVTWDKEFLTETKEKRKEADKIKSRILDDAISLIENGESPTYIKNLIKPYVSGRVLGMIN